MKNDRSVEPIKLLVLIILIGLLVFYTIPWVNRNSSWREYSGIDFHGYWYAGHYTREGINPYWAILNKNIYPVYWDPRYPDSGSPESGGNVGGFESDLILPIRYWDGWVATEYPVAQVMIVAPSATAPLTLFMGLFSWLSWPTARTVWLCTNVVLAALIPWIGFRLVEKRRRIGLTDKLIIALAFYNFYGLRQCLIVGQQSVICLFLLLLALLVEDRWLLAGILLGFGISKYSVGLPLFLVFLLQKRTRIIIVSLFVQFVGVLFLMPLSHGSLVDTAKAYLKILDLNFSQDGVHLLARFPDNHLIGYLLSVAALVLIAYFIIDMYFSSKNHINVESVSNLNILNLITVGLFLSVYHRIHDIPFAIFFFLPLMVIQAGDWGIKPRESKLITVAQYAIIAMLVLPTLPGKIISLLGISSTSFANLISENAVTTIAMLFMFSLSAWTQLKVLTKSDHQILSGEEAV